MQRLLSALLTCLLLSCLATAALAQTSGSLSGTIKDPSGASLAGVTVSAKNLGTGEHLNTTTNDRGAFVFPSLMPGEYSLTAEISGFKKAELPHVVVAVSTPAKVNLSLEVGEVSESVTVVGDTQEVINTVSPVLTNVINTRQVKDLPLPTRNPIDLARLQAGIAVTGTDTRNASVGGLRGTGTTVTQDGINAMDNFVKTSSFFAISAPTIGATSEFSITTGTVGSNAGRGVAQVNIVTKSGTNELHGNLFWQHRNDNLNANTFFNNATNVAKPLELQNWFGFTTGGPVWLPHVYDGRDRSFFFFSYEGFRENFSTTRTRTVLTQTARQGLFKYVGSNGQIQTVNLLNIGNARSLNPVTMALINQTPLPDNAQVGDGLNTAGASFNVNGRDPNDKINLRVDQKLFDSSRFGSHRLEWVFNRAWFLLTPDTFNGLEAPFKGGIDAQQQSTRTLTTVAFHSNFGAHMTNEFRIGYQRAPVGFLRKASPDRPFFTGFTSITNFDNTFMSQGRNTQLWQFIDNFSYVKGSHTLRMGADIQSVSATTFNDAGIHPTVNLGSNTANPTGILNSSFPFLPAGAAGSAITARARNIFSDITGFLSSGSQTFNVVSPDSGFVPGATRERNFLYRDVSFFIQDNWRMRRNFTFNYGVRYEFLGVPEVTNGLAIQPANGIAGLFGISGQGNLFKPGVLTGQSPTTLDFVSGKTGKPLFGDDWNNWAPFIGFAYSPNFESGPIRWLLGPEGKSSIRGGFAVTYLRDGFTVVSNALGVGTTNPGLIQSVANTTPTGVLGAGGVPVSIPTFTQPITDAANILKNTGNGLWTFDPNLRAPYVEQWSFGIEREIMPNTALEVRYVGNHAVKLFRALDFNEANIFENGFLQEFKNAKKNLAARGGTSFAPGPAGTVPLPIFTKLFTGLSSGSGFSNTTFINNLIQNNIGAMVNSLAFASTFRNNRLLLPPNFFVANPNAAFARLLGNASFSSYHSLQIEFRRRLSRGIAYQFDYTLSKVITDSEGSQSTLESFRTLRNPALDRHQASFDQTHRFIGNVIYELPFGPGKRFASQGGPLGKVVGGWQVASIVNWQTGPPFGIFSNRSTFNSFNPGINPAQLLGISFADFKKNIGVFRTPGGVFFINPKLLDITTDANGRVTGSTIKSGLIGQAPLGTFGNFPRNVLRSPPFAQTDFTIVKRTPFWGETRNVEFKMTLLNAFNNANFVFGGNNFDAASFGRITSTRGSARIIHFEVGVNF